MRYHRGLRNVTAGIDLAKEMFPNAGRIMVAGAILLQILGYFWIRKIVDIDF